MTSVSEPSGVVLVTDSTACLPESLLRQAGSRIRVVPLNVGVDGETFVEGEDISSDEVSDALKRKATVTTSRPAPARMLEVYEAARAEGAEAIVAVHASSALSSTVSSAHLAAAESPAPVTVIDSMTLGMAMGFAVLAGAAVAENGGDADAVATCVKHVALASDTFVYVDALDALKRGGRVGRAGALFGTALSIKPLLTLREGALEPIERVRTTSKAIDRLVNRTVETVTRLRTDHPDDDVVVAIHALTRGDLADQVEARIKDAFPDDAPTLVRAPLGAVVTAHVGAGTVATAVAALPVHSSDVKEALSMG